MLTLDLESNRIDDVPVRSVTHDLTCYVVQRQANVATMYGNWLARLPTVYQREQSVGVDGRLRFRVRRRHDSRSLNTRHVDVEDPACRSMQLLMASSTEAMRQQSIDVVEVIHGLLIRVVVQYARCPAEYRTLLGSRLPRALSLLSVCHAADYLASQISIPQLAYEHRHAVFFLSQALLDFL